MGTREKRAGWLVPLTPFRPARSYFTEREKGISEVNIREHAKAIRLRREQLDSEYPTGYLFITTVDNRMHGIKGGGTSEVNTDIAARHLVENTARIATGEEVESLRRKHQAAREVILRGQQALSPKPLSVVTERR